MLNTLLCQGWKTSLKLSFSKKLEVYLIVEFLPKSLRDHLEWKETCYKIGNSQFSMAENQASFYTKEMSQWNLIQKMNGRGIMEQPKLSSL